MPGTFILKPIEANLTHNTDLITKMSPYCSVSVGNQKIKGQICKKGGKHPHWNDAITVPVTGESKVIVELMDKDKITRDDNIGSFVLDLNEVQASGQVSKWYPLTYKNKAAGEILLETVYQPQGGAIGGQNQYYQQGVTGVAGAAGVSGLAGQSQYYQGQQYGAISGQNQYYEQEHLRTAQQGVIQKEEIIKTTTTTPAQLTPARHDISCATDISRNSHVWTEQRQVIEPHTFIKEVEVVETRPALKEIEVMESVKVLKDVQYTQAVPVRKQIEVVEPQVVMKEVEVIEPRLVTKTIQVIENVPVKRQVEVIEMRNAVQEVETLEPQTFTKQVEVTEFVPVRKQVEVTQPITLKKAVEFIEPVITTQIITKELQQPVIINEEITTTVGPASVVGITAEYGYYQQYGQISLSESQRLGGLQRWVGYETIFGGLNDQERLWEQQRLSRLNEQEWLRERERLMGFNEKDRLVHQRGFFSKIKQSLGLGQKTAGQYSTGQYSTGQYSTGQYGVGSTSFQNQHRWKGLDNLFLGLNEKERLYEQERLNRLNDQEWNLEKQRLLGFSEQDRLSEQRKLYGEFQKSGGYSHYKKTTETVEQTTSTQSGPIGQKIPSQYRPSANF